MGKITDKVMEVSDNLDMQARSRFLQQVMKDEEIDYETAWALCTGKTDPVEPEFTLAYKMSSPAWMMAMFGQHSRRKREQARDNFRKQLDDDELRLFEEYVDNEENTDKFKKKLKDEKKRKGVKE